MALVIGVVAQKGGVGKSTLARLIAREYAANGWTVKLADLDLNQGTSTRWNQRRLQQGVQPEISVEQFRSVQTALKAGERFDLVVFDGAPHASKQTLEIALSSALVILPTGTALDDLEPTVRLAQELKDHIPAKRIAIALCRVGDSEAELAEAGQYLKETGYFCFSGFLPERTGYRRASDLGRAATETTFPSLNRKADELAQSVVDRIEELG
jgi:chromosome partitioning protein